MEADARSLPLTSPHLPDITTRRPEVFPVMAADIMALEATTGLQVMLPAVEDGWHMATECTRPPILASRATAQIPLTPGLTPLQPSLHPLAPQLCARKALIIKVASWPQRVK